MAMITPAGLLPGPRSQITLGVDYSRIAWLDRSVGRIVGDVAARVSLRVFQVMG
jgi:hypothetical protein